MLRPHLFDHIGSIEIGPDGYAQRKRKNLRQQRRGNAHETQRFAGLMHRQCQSLQIAVHLTFAALGGEAA